jgi:hypothetical protein
MVIKSTFPLNVLLILAQAVMYNVVYIERISYRSLVFRNAHNYR